MTVKGAPMLSALLLALYAMQLRLMTAYCSSDDVRCFCRLPILPMVLDIWTICRHAE